MKYKGAPGQSLCLQLMFTPDITKYRLPAKSFDINWQQQKIEDQVIADTYCSKSCYMFEIYIIRSGTVPPQEYFDKTFDGYNLCYPTIKAMEINKLELEDLQPLVNEVSYKKMQYNLIEYSLRYHKTNFIKQYLEFAHKYIAGWF